MLVLWMASLALSGCVWVADPVTRVEREVYVAPAPASTPGYVTRSYYYYGYY
jgi:hypothetical protein